MNLLVVDWDYFFPIPHDKPTEWVYLYDWAHSEAHSEEFLNHLWQTRGATFLTNDLPLPTVHGWEKFSQRFQLSEDCELTYANSNVFAATDSSGLQLWDPTDTEVVYLFDAHHDSGYGKLKVGEV